MLAQEIISKKRDGAALTKAEINIFIDGLLNRSISEGQIAAFAMAVFFQGMNRAECIALTQSLQHSGTTLSWTKNALNGPVVDKHSTGGVGDKVSIMLAPMLAACGAFVPMISGRGMGHTGGTLDKMESIPGYNTAPNIPLFQKIVAKTGCAIVGQTAQLAPADKRLYSIRDVTATVESIPLITASILSKKLAAGLDGLVLDVKTGNGAFATGSAMAKDLARNMVEVGEGLGLPTAAVITDMSQVLGQSAGNALEMVEVIHYLTGEHRDPRLHHVVLELGAELLVLCGLSKNKPDATCQLERCLQTGLATEYFARMIAALGGPVDLIEKNTQYLSAAPIIMPVFTSNVTQQNIAGVNVKKLGNLIVELGGGRRRTEDLVDHKVGFSAIKGIGEQVDKNEPLLLIHANSKSAAQQVMAKVRHAFTFSETQCKVTDVVLERINIGQTGNAFNVASFNNKLDTIESNKRGLPR